MASNTPSSIRYSTASSYQAFQATCASQSQSDLLSHDIGSVPVDRGPGTASTLGFATFGGTVGIRSISPSNTVSINPYTTFGSYGTQLCGLQLDSGALNQLNGARAVFDFQRELGGGAIGNTSTRRSNYFGKIEVPTGNSTVLTFLGNYVHTLCGATAA